MGAKKVRQISAQAKCSNPLEQVGAPLVADAEAAKVEQPGERPLDHSAVPAQSLAGVDAATGKLRGDATSA